MRTIEYKIQEIGFSQTMVVTKDVARVLREEYLSYGWEVRVYEYY
ncbi:hypothetical protein [Vibrio maerlii]|nr:hypothetical protein [Vibrio maerlii]